jgi:hypothetical protein
MPKSYLERNRERIARVRDENLARQARTKVTKAPPLPKADKTTPAPDPQIGVRTYYKGQLLDWTTEQSMRAMRTEDAIYKAFGRRPNEAEMDVIVETVAAYRDD